MYLLLTRSLFGFPQGLLQVSFVLFFLFALLMLPSRGYAAVLGDQHTAVVMVNFSDTALSTPTSSEMNTIVFTDMKNYYVENSYNKMTVSGNVFGWYTMNIPSSVNCDWDQIKNGALQAANNDVDFSQYSRMVIVFADAGCGGGLSTQGPVDITLPNGTHQQLSITWVAASNPWNSYNYYVLKHEFGHNLGLQHASFLRCGSVSWSTKFCTSEEYGDGYSLMSDQDLGQFSAPHKEALGWFAPSNITTVSTTGDYTILPLETATTSAQVLRIPRYPSGYLYVEYRQPIGSDAGLTGDAFQGALVHTITSDKHTQLWDLSPTVGTDYKTTALLPGNTFTDPGTGTAVSIVGTPGAQLTLHVVKGNNTDHTDPAITINSPTNTSTVTGIVPITVTATDNTSVKMVEYYIDGTLKSTQATAPFTYSWDTTTVSSSTPHTIITRAYDNSYNVTQSGGITVKTTNAAQPYPLSDTAWVSATTGWGSIQKDKSIEGNPIVLDGTSYAKGIGTHALSEIHYNLGASCSQFSASVGIDDEVVDTGSVIFQVFTDGAKVFDSGVMTPSTTTKNLLINTTGKQDLKLLVTDAGDGMDYDHADWANPTITCGATNPTAIVVPVSTYLSDINWTSGTTGWGSIQKNLSVGGNSLSLSPDDASANIYYGKGLGVHAVSDIKYNLGATCTNFSASVGVDDESTGAGSVDFQVFLDGVKAFDSGVMDVNSQTKRISLNTTGKNELRLYVTDGGDGASSDHADWADAQITCAPGVNITSPTNNALVKNNRTTVISANATTVTSPIASVAFYVSGTLKCTDTTSPYTCSWTVPSGTNKTYTLTAKATDTKGNSTTSSVVTVRSN